MTKKEYNGWYNWETWLAKLWIENEQSSQEYAMELAQGCWEHNESNREEAVRALATSLQEMQENSLPEMSGFVLDLVYAGLREVNWSEIAETIMDDACEEYDLKFSVVSDEERSGGR